MRTIIELRNDQKTRSHEFPVRVFLLALFVIACFASSEPRIAQEEGPDKEEARIFQKQVEKVAEGTGIPGMVVAVREPDGRVYLAAVGMSDIARNEPMRTDNSFYIGSISQSMLAAIVFTLEEEGKLRLEDPISRYLDFPGGRDITVEMLMDNSSGLGDWTGQGLRSTDNPQLPKLLKSPQNPDSLIEFAADTVPVFKPGERQEGCYTNLLLLSRLIANVEGKPAMEVFQDRIFRPLGMRNTRYLNMEEKQESLSKGYRAEEGWGERIGRGLADVSWADKNLRGLAELGIVSNAKDMLKYHVGLRNGKLISKESFERMCLVRPGKINGLGYQISRGRRGTWEGNNGHAVGHLSVSYYHIEKGIYIVVMGNLGDTALPLAGLWDLRYMGSQK